MVSNLQSILMRTRVQRNKNLPTFAEWTIQGFVSEEYLMPGNANDNFELISGTFCAESHLQKKKLTLMVFVASTLQEKGTNKTKQKASLFSKPGR